MWHPKKNERPKFNEIVIFFENHCKRTRVDRTRSRKTVWINYKSLLKISKYVNPMKSGKKHGRQVELKMPTLQNIQLEQDLFLILVFTITIGHLQYQ